MTRLLIIIVLLAGLAVWARRADKRSSGAGSIKVTARASVARGCGTAIVEADGRRFLIGWGPQGPAPIAELNPAPIVPAGTVEVNTHGTPDTGPSLPGVRHPEDRSVLTKIRRATTRTYTGHQDL